MDPVQHSPVCQSDKDLRLQVAVDAGGYHKLLLVIFAPTERYNMQFQYFSIKNPRYV